MFAQLPSDIATIVSAYLKSNDCIQLMFTCKNMLSSLNRFYTLILEDDQAVKYAKDVQFRELIDSLIHVGKRYKHMEFRIPNHSFIGTREELGHFSNSRYVNLSNTKTTDITKLSNVYRIDISDTEVSDVSSLASSKIVTMNNCSNVSFVESLCNVDILSMQFSNAVDIHKLTGVRDLDVSYSHFCHDVLTLKNVSRLSIVCTDVRDVNMLGSFIDR